MEYKKHECLFSILYTSLFIEKGFEDIVYILQESQLKVEHKGNHVSFLDLDIKIENNVFVYKLFDKRDKFPFFIVQIPYLSSDM